MKKGHSFTVWELKQDGRVSPYLISAANTHNSKFLPLLKVCTKALRVPILGLQINFSKYTMLNLQIQNLQIMRFNFVSFPNFILLLLFFLASPCHEARSILVPHQGLNLCLLQWKCGVLTTGPPENSPSFSNFSMERKDKLAWYADKVTWSSIFKTSNKTTSWNLILCSNALLP